MIARPGPLPMVDLVHYPVTAGKEGQKIRVSLPFSVRNDTLYQVEMNIRGDQFRATVNGHVRRFPTTCSLRQRSLLLRNQGDGRFVDYSFHGGEYFSDLHRGRGLAIGDDYNMTLQVI